MARKQKHHITYDPEWTVKLTGWEHKVITHIQSLKPSQENLEHVGDFLSAVAHEYNRIKFRLFEAQKGNLNP